MLRWGGESGQGLFQSTYAESRTAHICRSVAKPMQPVPAIRPLDNASVALSRFIALLIPSGTPPNCIFHLRKKYKMNYHSKNKKKQKNASSKSVFKSACATVISNISLNQ